VKDVRDICQEIIKCMTKKYASSKENWQIGFTKMFLKEETRTGLERMLGEAMITQIVRI
jgi:hypothetical protein